MINSKIRMKTAIRKDRKIPPWVQDIEINFIDYLFHIAKYGKTTKIREISTNLLEEIDHFIMNEMLTFYIKEYSND